MITLSDNDIATLRSMEAYSQSTHKDFWKIYEFLANTLVDNYGVSQTDTAVLWLKGATQANRDTGVYSAIIRTYSATQGLLRYGDDQQGLMQAASDSVAQNLLNDILGRNAPDWPYKQVPDIRRIGEADAKAVGTVLFSRDANDSAADKKANSAWAGVFLFTMLSSPQEERLMRTGIPGQIDTANDWRDVLFGYKSYQEALKAAAIKFLVESPVQQAADGLLLGKTVISYLSKPGQNFKNLSDALPYSANNPVTANPAFRTALGQIDRYGVEKLLDYLYAAVSGQNFASATNDSSFAANALALANFMGTQGQGWGAELVFDSSKILTLAKGSGAQALSARNALLNLTPFVMTGVTYPSQVQNQLTLHDPNTGQGQLSENWLADRAAMLAYKLGYDGRGLAYDKPYPLSGAGSKQLFIDQVTGVSIDTSGAGNEATDRRFYFGSSSVDNYTAGELNDRLYGMAGDDVLKGEDGNDWLEGGVGNDQLRGGMGADVLVGGADNDTAYGEDGNDSLYGGVGNDNLFGGANDDLLQGWTGVDYMEGGSGKDQLRGGDDTDFLFGDSENDALYGDGGDDNLTGGTGNDWLEGGDGDDVYAFNDGDGSDVITDSDGRGRISINGNVLPVGIGFAGDDAWVSADGKVRFQFAPDSVGSTKGTLTITYTGGKVTVREYEKGSMGVQVQETPQPNPMAGEGTALSDNIFTSNPISAGDGNDFIVATGNNSNTIDGGDGNDFISVGMGARRTKGGAGDDAIVSTWYTQPDVINDTAWQQRFAGWSWSHSEFGVLHGALDQDISDDTLGRYLNLAPEKVSVNGVDKDAWRTYQFYANTDGQWIDAEAGNDAVGGGDGDDTIFGGVGSDTLGGNRGSDLIAGGTDADEITGNWGQDTLQGQEGNDSLYGGSEDDVLLGGDGNDALDGDDNFDGVSYQAHGNDLLDGGKGDDYLFGMGGSDTLLGGDGNDTLEGGVFGIPANYDGKDYLDGEAGNDLLNGGDDDDTLIGGSGHDELYGDGAESAALGSDWLDGGEGNDTVVGASGNDTLNGGSGNDMMAGDGNNLALALHGDDTVNAGIGNDTVIGNGGNDSLFGDSGDDSLQGDSGNDILNGGDGIDALMGCEGNDLLYGDAGDDGITGTGAAKQTNGGMLYGGDGNDTIYGGSGQDLLAGDAGNDLLSGDDGDDQLDGGDGDDSLQGGSGFDVMLGGAGNDTYLLTGGDYDTIYETSGYDRLVLANTSVDSVQIWQFGSKLQINIGQEALVVIEDGFLGAIDRFKFGQTDVYLEDLQPQNLNLTPSQASRANYQTQDSPSGEAPIPTETEFDPDDLDLRSLLKLSTNGFIIDGDEKTNTLYGGGGADSISALESGDIVYAAGGNDMVDAGIGADLIYGEEGNDSLVGGDDQDTLIGGIGNDTLVGGNGSDRYVFANGSGSDLINDQGTDAINGNTIVFTDIVDKDAINILQYGPNIVMEMPDGSRLTINNYFGSGAAAVNFQIQFADGTAWGYAEVKRHIQQSVGTEGNDTLSAEYDEVLGWSKPVYLDGKEGNDLLTGGSGNDTLQGGDGRDLLRGSQGDDLIFGDGGITQGEGDSIDAAEGNDTIIGGGGEDTINGGFGDDTYVYRLGETGDIINGQYDFDNNVIEVDGTPSSIRFVRPFYDRKDLIVLMQNGGPNEYSMVIDDLFLPFQTNERNTFAVRIKGTDTLYSWDDILRLMLTPTSGNDPLWGTHRSESIYGADGNDDLHGWAGNDTLNGGHGLDTLEGGLGDDVYVVDKGQKRDVLNEESGSDTVRFGVGVTGEQLALIRSGDDLLLSSSDGQLQLRVTKHFAQSNNVRAGAVERFEFADGSSWDLSRIDGAAIVTSAETMTGGSGNDVFVYDNIGDRIVEAENGGDDTVQASIDFLMGGRPNLENIEAIGSLDIRLEGNSLSNRITGNAADNSLYGGDGGNDTLIGGMGDDTLSGYWSNDTLQGGLGNDYYIFSKDYRSTNGPDEHLALELAGEGNDTIFSYRYDETLSDNVENLTMGSLSYGLSAPRQFVGNDLDNIIDSRSTERVYVKNLAVLDGGLGADTLYGDVLSSTTYIIDRLDDVVIEPSGYSELAVDTVQSPLSYTLGANIENLVLLGTDTISATGNELNNTLDGSQNTAANVLRGLAGDDVYIVGEGDSVVEEANGGSDTLVLSNYGQAVRVSDYANIENIKLKNYISTNLYGNDADNKLWGGYYITSIDGGSGDDIIWDATITGELGQFEYSNAMFGGNGNDVIYSIHGQDTVSGGTGNDTLEGWHFLYDKGDGDDVINPRNNYRHSSDSLGYLRLGEGITIDDLEFVVAGDDLLLEMKDGNGQILVKNQFLLNANGQYFVGVSLRFADGSEVEGRIVRAIALKSGTPSQTEDDLVGSVGDDIIDGLAGGDMIYGLSGNDSLIGSAGADLINAGVGHDSLLGGEDTDTLIGGIGNDLLDGGLADDSLLGGAGNDVIRGGEGNDSLIGDVGDDQLFDDGGNDVVQGGDGNDTLFAGAGNDSLSGGAGTDSFRFDVGFGQDTIAWATSDGQPATDGDWIEFGQGITLANVALSSNYISESVVSLTITINGTNDSLLAYNGSGHFNTYLRGIRFANGSELSISEIEQLTGMGTNGNDSLVGDGSNNYLRGLAGNDTLNAGDGNDTLDGGEGIDALIGGNGDDHYVVDNLGDTITEGAGAGYDIAKSSVDFTLPNEVERLELLGPGALNGTGNASANYLIGNVGNNILDGKGGADTMDGGAGSDIYYVDNTADVISDSSSDYQDIDTVISSATYTLTGQLDNLTLTGSNAINGTGNDRENVLRGNSGVNVLKGGEGNDTYYISTGDSVVENPGISQDRVYADVTFTLGANIEELHLTGSSNINGTGNNSYNFLYGNAGNNILDGKGDDDWMEGGAGNDTYIQDSEGDAAIEEVMLEAIDPSTGETFYYWADTGGIDTVKSSANVGGVNEDDGTLWGLGNNIENLELTGTTAQLGYANDIANSILGNSAANTLRGFEGNDTLNGGAGADTMFGGIGDDTYVVDGSSDVVTEYVGEGTDLVQSAITYSLASLAEMENLTLTGSSAINGTGNAKDNILIGNSANNTLTGGAGNDRLDGGAGNDTMVGGTGNDTYVVNISTDVVTENLNEGIDTVEASATYSIASQANVENLTLTGTSAINATGNAAANVLTGNSGANTLDGGTGVDTLVGGTGNDTYVVDNAADVITENASEGTDLVNAGVTFSLATFVNVENLTLTGSSAINATGNVQANVLTGNSGNNTLDGGVGNDTLNGGSGNDTMLGGAGNDTYVFNVATDVATENLNEGIDTIETGITLSLAAINNVENLTLTGTSAVNATGNALDNVLKGNSANNKLTGNAGNDRLDGGTGNDTMLGGTGNDTYVVNISTDVVTENANEGIDTVESSITYSVASLANLENITLTGSTAINATGNAAANALIGNSGVNTLTGGAGNDTLDGAAGNDSLVGGTGNDTYVLGRGYGAETVTENDTTAGNTDVASFMAGIATDQIWFRKVNTNDLEVSIIGTSDTLTLKSWYSGSQYHVEQFKTADGKLLVDADVQKLVDAMAAFAPPAAGQTTLPSNYQTTLNPVLAANWH